MKKSAYQNCRNASSTPRQHGQMALYRGFPIAGASLYSPIWLCYEWSAACFVVSLELHCAGLLEETSTHPGISLRTADCLQCRTLEAHKRRRGIGCAILHSYACTTEPVCCMQATELPVLDEDRQLDADSCSPGEQQFEKLTAGLYMGDIARRIMLRFCSLCCIKHAGANRTILTCRIASQPCWHIIYEDMQSILSLCVNWEGSSSDQKTTGL